MTSPQQGSVDELMISQFNSLFKIYGKVFGLLATMVVGALFPRAHTLSFLIQYLLMAMLFFAFLDIEFKPEMFQRSVLWILLANVAVACGSYAVFTPFDMTLALAAFMTAIAPTATAAPVLIGFIGGKIEYVVTAVLFTNLSIAVIIPVTLPFLLGAQVQISVWQVLKPVLITMFVPDPGAWL
jgi:BASS family bile acid:Na+ symporter